MFYFVLESYPLVTSNDLPLNKLKSKFIWMLVIETSTLCWEHLFSVLICGTVSPSEAIPAFGRVTVAIQFPLIFLSSALSHNFPLSEPGDWTRIVKARGCVRLKHSSAGCLVGLLTYLALPIDSISHSWFTGDRGTLFILAWGLTKKKRGNILKAGEKNIQGHSTQNKMVSCLLLHHMTGSYSMPI